jgi:hypothetical protein
MSSLRNGVSVVSVAMLAIACTDHTSPVLTRLMDARRLSAELQVSFTQAADAANRAVMADTDEVSVTFAHEAQEQAQLVQRDLDQVDGILQSLGYSDETELLKGFREAFTKYRELDREILVLAVENTNLKAQRLSFGPAHTAANALRDSLSAGTAGVAAKDQWHASALAAKATLAVREIEVLQAPHIAASEDAVMTQFEHQMAALEATARSALQELDSFGTPVLHAAVDAANKALTDFMTINAQIISLSRRNSNVRSLALSLGQKRTLAAVCEGALRALNDRLTKRDFAATR